MKAVVLAAILPCAVLAEESAPISFMSVKPVAEVAADAAASDYVEAQHSFNRPSFAILW